MSLDSFVRTCHLDEARVTQRHKRVIRIIAKLTREGVSSKLARLEDIGGVRVVVPTLVELNVVLDHIHKVWNKQDCIKRERDLIDRPRDTGYRAYHVIVERNQRRIEVQLRTRLQHDWADSIERLGRQIGIELKTGEGPPEILQILRVIADLNYYDELAQPPPDELTEEYSSSIEGAREILSQLAPQ